jgi:hypothetical protein
MRILKSSFFIDNEALVTFINDNNIPREDILEITQGGGYFAVFFYSDSEIEEKTRNIWGKLES